MRSPKSKRATAATVTLKLTARQGGAMSKPEEELTMSANSTSRVGFLHPHEIPLTMSSREIAELTHKRHDNVKRTIVALSDDGILTLPQIEETSFLDSKGKVQRTTEYRLGKRDSFVVTGRLSPKFMASVFDRWLELEAGAASPSVTHDHLLDMTNFVETGAGRRHEVALKEIGSVRGAVLHYLKESVVGSIARLREYLDQRFVASRERDARVIHAVDALGRQQTSLTAIVGEVITLAKRAGDPGIIIAADWVTVGGVYGLAGVSMPVPRLRALSGRISASLMAFAFETDRQVDIRSPHYDRRVRLYRATLVKAWLKSRGRSLIEQHLAKHSSQTVIPFPAKTDEEVR